MWPCSSWVCVCVCVPAHTYLHSPDGSGLAVIASTSSSKWTSCVCALLRHFAVNLLMLIHFIETHTTAHMCYTRTHKHTLSKAWSLALIWHTHTRSLAAPFWSMEIIYSCHDAWFPICYWDPEQLEGEKGGRDGREREKEERQLERLPTAGNQFPVTESLLGSKEEVVVLVEGRRSKEMGFSLLETGGKMKCQPVCLLRLGCWSRGRRGRKLKQQGVEGREEVAAVFMDGWLSPFSPSALVCHYWQIHTPPCRIYISIDWQVNQQWSQSAFQIIRFTV